MSEVSWEANRSPDQPTSSDQKSTNSPKQSLEGSERAEDNSPNRIRSNATSETEKEVSRHRQLYVGNIPPDATVSQVQKLFEEFQPVSRVDLKSGFAFVFLEDGEQAERAIRLLNGTKKEEIFGFRTLKVEYAKDASLVKQKEEERKRRAEQNPTESLFVTNFPSYFRERDLERIFDQFGKVVNVEIIRSYAFITFASIKDASHAYERMHHFTLDDGRELHVEFVTASRVGRRIPRERESRFGYRRRYSSLSPRRRTSRSRTRSLEREDKRRRLNSYRTNTERRYSSRTSGSRTSSPVRERSPLRHRGIPRNSRRVSVERDLHREYREGGRSLRKDYADERSRDLHQDRSSPPRSRIYRSPARSKERDSSSSPRREIRRREPERRRSISPRSPEYSRRREMSNLSEASRRQGFSESDRKPLPYHNGERRARTSSHYYDRSRHSFRQARSYEDRDFQRRERSPTEHRNGGERNTVEGRIR